MYVKALLILGVAVVAYSTPLLETGADEEVRQFLKLHYYITTLRKNYSLSRFENFFLGYSLCFSKSFSNLAIQSEGVSCGHPRTSSRTSCTYVI